LQAWYHDYAGAKGEKPMRLHVILAGILGLWLFAEAQIQMARLQEQEPNNSLGAPQVITPALSSSQGVVILPATINPTNDRDYYRFRVQQSGIYSLRVDSNRDTVLTLYDSAGTMLTSNDNGGNPDIPNRLASGITAFLGAGDYIAEVRYGVWTGVCRYALRLFPGEQAPDMDLTEPNDTRNQAVPLGAFTGGELPSDIGFSAYGGGDVDVYTFKSAVPITGLRIRTETYIDTVLRVHAPDGTVYENDDSSWDPLNGLASEVHLPVGLAGTYFIEIRTYGVWGGYYRLRITAELPTEIVLQDGSALFRLRSLTGAGDRAPTNNADWLHNGRDHLFQLGWWYRIESVQSREYLPTTLNTVGQDLPHRATLLYQEPEGVYLVFIYELREQPSGGSTLTCTAYALNLRNHPATVHLFHYVDPDVGGAVTNHAEWWDGRIWIQGAASNFVYLTPIVPVTHWEVTPYPQTLQRLLDNLPTNLADGNLPFEGDFTGAFQWRRLLNAASGFGVRVHYALNSDELPLQGDVDGNGCIDDRDLIAMLFAFGRVGTLLPEDVNLDGMVDDGDLVIVLFQFGTGC
jgi:hypothetical protein